MKALPLVAVEDYNGLHCVRNSPLSSMSIIGMTWADIKKAGVTHQRILVHREIIEPLIEAQRFALTSGCTLTIIDGWHPDAAYESLFGKANFSHMSEHARYLIESRVHATGMAVNVLLYDKVHHRPIPLSIPEDGDAALFEGFYRLSTEGNDSVRIIDRPQRRNEEKFRRQRILIQAMMRGGFTIAPQKRVCHFEYKALAEMRGRAVRF